MFCKIIKRLYNDKNIKNKKNTKNQTEKFNKIIELILNRNIDEMYNEKLDFYELECPVMFKKQQKSFINLPNDLLKINLKIKKKRFQ